MYYRMLLDKRIYFPEMLHVWVLHESQSVGVLMNLNLYYNV